MLLTRLNNRIRVDAITEEEVKIVDKHFSFPVPGADFIIRSHKKKHRKKVKGCWVCRWDGKHHFLTSNGLPGGFVNEVKGLVDCTITDARRLPERKYDWNCSASLRGYQQNAVDAAIKNGNGIVEAATGAGKTIIAAAIVAKLGLRTIIAVPTKVIHTQFVEAFKKFTDIDVGIIQGSTFEVDKPVVIAVMAGITKDKEKARKALANRDVLLIDEYHKSAAKTWRETIMDCNAYYRIGLTATPFRKTQLECEFLRACTGEVVYSIDTKTLQDKGFLSVADVRIVKCNVYPPKPVYNAAEKKFEEVPWVEKHRECIATNDDRNNMIAEIANYHRAIGDKVLIITSWAEHADLIGSRIASSYIYLSGKDTAKQAKEKADEFKAMSGGVMIGTSVLDLGFDVPAIDVVIIAGGGDAKGRTQQRLGRGLRKAIGKSNAVIYDFLDVDNGAKKQHFLNHSYNRISVYESLDQEVNIFETVREALQKK